MVHELLGIQDNKVDLRNIGKVPKDQQVACICISAMPFLSFMLLIIITLVGLCHSLLQEVVLSSEQDAFFKANMFENFGDLGMNIKRMVDEFQQVAKSNQNIQTIGTYRASVFTCLHTKLGVFDMLRLRVEHLCLLTCRGHGQIC